MCTEDRRDPAPEENIDAQLLPPVADRQTSQRMVRLERAVEHELAPSLTAPDLLGRGIAADNCEATFQVVMTTDQLGRIAAEGPGSKLGVFVDVQDHRGDGWACVGADRLDAAPVPDRRWCPGVRAQGLTLPVPFRARHEPMVEDGRG